MGEEMYGLQRRIDLFFHTILFEIYLHVRHHIVNDATVDIWLSRISNDSAV